MGRPLKIAKAQAVLTITNTATTGSIVTISGGNLTTSPTVGIIAGMPFVVASNVGGLLAGTTYYVNKILSNTTFSVSATQLSVQPQVLATLTNTSAQTVKASFAVVDAYFNNPNGGNGFPQTNSNTYSVVGGNTAIVGPQVLAQVAIGINGTGTIAVSSGSANITGVGTDLVNTFVNGTAVSTSDGVFLGYIADIANANAEFATFAANSLASATDTSFVYANDEAGFIVRQKGKQKYLVQGTVSGLVGACYTANLANTALTPNTMRILATYANAATQTVQSLSDHTGELFTATSGPVATGNIVFQNAAPVFATFNTAAVANAANAMPYPLVTIASA